MNQFVYAEDGAAVRHVMVAGTLIVQDRVLNTLDVPRLARKTEAARERLEAANADARGLAEKLSVVVGGCCPGLAAEPYPVRHHLNE